MSLTDPQSITISGVTTPLPRVSTGKGNSEYQSADGSIKLEVSNAYGRRTRRVLRVDHNKVTPDPFIPANNVKVSMSCYIVFDTPEVGYTSTEAKAVYDGLKGLAAAGTDAAITKLLAGES